MDRRLCLLILGVSISALTAPAILAHDHHHHHHHRAWSTAPGPWGPQGAPAGPRYDADTVTTLRGTVAAVEVLPARRGQLGGMHLTLKTEEKTVPVHAGPTWFIERSGFTLARGNTVEVTGSLVEFEGSTYLIAREVKKEGKALKLRDEQGIPLWSGGPGRP